MRRVVLPGALSVLVAGVLGACQAGGAEGGGAAGAADTGAPSGTMTPPGDSIRVSLEVPARVARGDTVSLALHVENTGESPTELHLTGRPPAFDVIVTDAAGDTVWRRLEGATIQQILVLETLAPGEGRTFEERWDQRTRAGELVAPGTYVVRGELPAERRELVSPPETLRVTPE